MNSFAGRTCFPAGADQHSKSDNPGWRSADLPKVKSPKFGLHSFRDHSTPQADIVGIDAPFGWPAPFVAAVGEWTLTEWNEVIRDGLSLRETDRHVRRQSGVRPLSVSADRIALPAMRAMALLKRHGVIDRSGDGRFFEVYPAGSLAIWKLTPKESYKKNTVESFKRRRPAMPKIYVWQ